MGELRVAFCVSRGRAGDVPLDLPTTVTQSNAVRGSERFPLPGRWDDGVCESPPPRSTMKLDAASANAKFEADVALLAAAPVGSPSSLSPPLLDFEMGENDNTITTSSPMMPPPPHQSPSTEALLLEKEDLAGRLERALETANAGALLLDELMGASSSSTAAGEEKKEEAIDVVEMGEAEEEEEEQHEGAQLSDLSSLSSGILKELDAVKARLQARLPTAGEEEEAVEVEDILAEDGHIEEEGRSLSIDGEGALLVATRSTYQVSTTTYTVQATTASSLLSSAEGGFSDVVVPSGLQGWASGFGDGVEEDDEDDEEAISPWISPAASPQGSPPSSPRCSSSGGRRSPRSLSETRSPLDFASPRTPAATTHPFNMTSPCAASPLATFASASAPGSVAKLRGGTERLDAILHELRTAKAAPRNLGRIARILNVNMGEGEEGGGEEGTNRRRRGLGKLFADSDEEESDVEQSGRGLSEANVVAVS